MTFGRSIQTVFTKYAEFRGAASRSEFWWWILFISLASAALNAVAWWSSSFASEISPESSLAGVWAIAVLLPTLAVTVRRLRDAGFEWGDIFWVLLPFAGVIVLIVLCAQPSRQFVVGAEGKAALSATSIS
jgi:uncharacterized membrane protein YhaH (DUF805 family)